MTLGAISFGMLSRSANEDRRLLYIITFFVAAIAASSYLAMALGQGVAIFPGRTIYWARYIDWVLTTPLLLFDLALLARTGRNQILALIGADVFMIVTGLVASLSPQPLNYIWWTVSTGAFIALLLELLKQLSAATQTMPPEVAGLARTLTILTGVLWTAYPIVWLIGTEGLEPISLDIEILTFMLLDLTAKVGFGFILLTNRSALEQVSTEASTPSTVSPSWLVS